MNWPRHVAEAIARQGAVVRVTVIRAEGSTPREVGAAMLVGLDGIEDTIGGGALENQAIAHARTLLAMTDGAAWYRECRDFALGPSLGQCCGGAVRLLFERFAQGEQPVLADFGRIADGSRVVLLRPLTTGIAPQAASRGLDPFAVKRMPVDRRNCDQIQNPEDDALRSGHPPFVIARSGATKQSTSGHSAGEWIASHRQADARNDEGGSDPASMHHAQEHDPQKWIPVLRERSDVIRTDKALADANWPANLARFMREWPERGYAPSAALLPGRKSEPNWFIEPLAPATTPLVLYGAGHVGHALARVLQGLPFHVTWVDARPGIFPEDAARYAVLRNHEMDPAALTATLPENAIHIVMTHSHPLDLAICHAVLTGSDFRFLGLIGSETKRARFLKRLREAGVAEERLARLACPIGLPGVKGKQPAVIAVGIAAQLLEIAGAE